MNRRNFLVTTGAGVLAISNLARASAPKNGPAMTVLPGNIMLLAQVSREDFGRGFRGATSQLSWTDLVPYFAAAILGAIGISLYRWIKRRNDMTSRFWARDGTKTPLVNCCARRKQSLSGPRPALAAASAARH